MTRQWIPSACAFLLVIGTLGTGCETKPSPTVQSVTVAGVAPAVGGAKQFAVIARFIDGSTKDVTNETSGGPLWWSSSANIATVSSGGSVTGVASGAATIYARYHNATGNLVIQIP